MEYMDVTWFPVPQLPSGATREPMTRLRNVLFSRAMPLPTPGDVFKTLLGRFQGQISYISDGHLGERKETFHWQTSLLVADGLEHLTVSGSRSPGQQSSKWQTTLACWETRIDVHALKSYRIFADFKSSGLISPNVRFQVSFPWPSSFTSACISPAWQRDFEPYYETAVIRSLERLQREIPHADLAIQFDCCSPLTSLSTKRAVDLLNTVAVDVALGLNIQDDSNRSSHNLVRDVEAVGTWAQELVRRISYVHIPFTSDGLDDSLLAMRRLWSDTGCELYLGLVDADIVYTKQKVEAATAVLGASGFGVSSSGNLAGSSTGELEDTLKAIKDASMY